MKSRSSPEYMRKYLPEWRKKNAEKYRAQVNASKHRLKARFLLAYGNKCALCGFANPAALSIDHIAGDGCLDKYPGGARRGGGCNYRKALNEMDHSKYRILCMNCQLIERERLRAEKKLRGQETSNIQWAANTYSAYVAKGLFD